MQAPMYAGPFRAFWPPVGGHGGAGHGCCAHKACKCCALIQKHVLREREELLKAWRQRVKHHQPAPAGSKD